jgi:hypothetical protein
VVVMHLPIMCMLHLQHIAVVQEWMRPGTEEAAMAGWGFGKVRLVVEPFPVNATGKKQDWKNK